MLGGPETPGTMISSMGLDVDLSLFGYLHRRGYNNTKLAFMEESLSPNVCKINQLLMKEQQIVEVDDKIRGLSLEEILDLYYNTSVDNIAADKILGSFQRRLLSLAHEFAFTTNRFQCSANQLNLCNKHSVLSHKPSLLVDLGEAPLRNVPGSQEGSCTTRKSTQRNKPRKKQPRKADAELLKSQELISRMNNEPNQFSAKISSVLEKNAMFTEEIISESTNNIIDELLSDFDISHPGFLSMEMRSAMLGPEQVESTNLCNPEPECSVPIMKPIEAINQSEDALIIPFLRREETNASLSDKDKEVAEVLESHVKETTTTDMNISPLKTKENKDTRTQSPFRGNTSPLKSYKSPLKTNKSPFKDNKSPVKGHKSPTKSNKSPFKGNKSPLKGHKSPLRTSKSPLKVNTSLKKSNKSPTKINNSPTKINKGPLKGKKSPLKGKKSPLKGKKSPLKGKKSPLKGKKSPLESRKTALKGNTTSLKNNKSPLTNFEGTLKRNQVKGSTKQTPYESPVTRKRKLNNHFSSGKYFVLCNKYYFRLIICIFVSPTRVGSEESTSTSKGVWLPLKRKRRTKPDAQAKSIIDEIHTITSPVKTVQIRSPIKNAVQIGCSSSDEDCLVSRLVIDCDNGSPPSNKSQTPLPRKTPRAKKTVSRSENLKFNLDESIESCISTVITRIRRSSRVSMFKTMAIYVNEWDNPQLQFETDAFFDHIADQESLFFPQHSFTQITHPSDPLIKTRPRRRKSDPINSPKPVAKVICPLKLNSPPKKIIWNTEEERETQAEVVCKDNIDTASLLSKGGLQCTESNHSQISAVSSQSRKRIDISALHSTPLDKQSKLEYLKNKSTETTNSVSSIVEPVLENEKRNSFENILNNDEEDGIEDGEIIEHHDSNDSTSISSHSMFSSFDDSDIECDEPPGSPPPPSSPPPPCPPSPLHVREWVVPMHDTVTILMDSSYTLKCNSLVEDNQSTQVVLNVSDTSDQCTSQNEDLDVSCQNIWGFSVKVDEGGSTERVDFDEGECHSQLILPKPDMGMREMILKKLHQT